jgi:LmbE family N-acetylglucosaminyl deacetylase
MSTLTYQHIYLSPHYDDAALSCGGAIQQQVRAGQSVLVITLCAAAPPADQPLSPFAQELHKAWGDFAGMVATRRAEDEAAMRILGVEARRLNFTDCIYRGHPKQGEWFYNEVADIFGPIHPLDVPLSAEMVRAVLDLVAFDPATTIYAPLTVGHHVDHQLTQAAAWQLREQGWAVVFYEDYPYVAPDYPFTRPEKHSYTLEATLAAKTQWQWQPHLRYLSEADLAVKIGSIRAYRSQLEMLFGGEDKMESLVRVYALLVGEGQLAERVWSAA